MLAWRVGTLVTVAVLWLLATGFCVGRWAATQRDEALATAPPAWLQQAGLEDIGQAGDPALTGLRGRAATDLLTGQQVWVMAGPRTPGRPASYRVLRQAVLQTRVHDGAEWRPEPAPVCRYVWLVEDRVAEELAPVADAAPIQ